MTSCCAKIHQRLHFLRRLRLFGVSVNIMLIFYRASIESILRYGITSWFGNLTVKFKSQIARVAKMAGKIMGMSSPPITPQAIFEQAVIRQARNIVSDPRTQHRSDSGQIQAASVTPATLVTLQKSTQVYRYLELCL